MIEFTILGAPVPKGRPRARIIGKGARQMVQVYTPAETVAAETALRLQARRFRPRKPFTGPLHILTVFVVPAPARFDADRSRIWPHVKPDDDNMRKLVLDALSGEFFEDDGQVCGGSSWKVYGHPPRTIVRIRQLTVEDHQQLMREIGEEIAQPQLFGEHP